MRLGQGTAPRTQTCAAREEQRLELLMERRHVVMMGDEKNKGSESGSFLYHCCCQVTWRRQTKEIEMEISTK